MNRYAVARRLRTPLTAYRRRKTIRSGRTFNRSVWEAHDYRPAMRRFADAAREQPDILVDVELREGANVLDVGAFEGHWSTRLLARVDRDGPRHVHVHAFEPEPSAVTQFREGVVDARVQLHEYGLAGRDRRERLAIGGPGSSVFVDPSAPNMYGAVEVELRDVDRVLEELGIQHIDLIKINIEGGEYELLDRLYETDRLRHTGVVIVQFHEFAPAAHRSRRRNRARLAETHTCTWCYPWIFERWDPR